MAVAKIYNENTGQWEAAITGPSGVVDVTSPITNTGTPTEANIGIDDATPTSVGVVKGTTNDGTNTALGDGAFTSNTTGNDNTAVGSVSLAENTTGNNNTALGYLTMQSNIDGNNNTAVGYEALKSNVSGIRNTAVGYLSLESNEDNFNTAFGYLSGRNNTTGERNTFIGYGCAAENTSGTRNTSLGMFAFTSNLSGNFNVILGYQAGRALDGADRNTIVGYEAGFNLASGANNTILGNGGQNLVSGNNNLILGYEAEASTTTVSNEITLGDSSITSLRCNVQSISSLSDERDKTNIQDSPLGLDLIQRLRPVTFDWDRRDGSFAGRKDVGFIAQDVVQVEDELEIEDTLRMSYRSNPEKLEVAPARLIPVLTKAIQELSEQNAELKARLDKLEGK